MSFLQADLSTSLQIAASTFLPSWSVLMSSMLRSSSKDPNRRVRLKHSRNRQSHHRNNVVFLKFLTQYRRRNGHLHCWRRFYPRCGRVKRDGPRLLLWKIDSTEATMMRRMQRMHLTMPLILMGMVLKDQDLRFKGFIAMLRRLTAR